MGEGGTILPGGGGRYPGYLLLRLYGGTPIQSWWGGGGPSSLVEEGDTQGISHWDWMGVPLSSPDGGDHPPWWRRGVPRISRIETGWGYPPPIKTGWGIPPAPPPPPRRETEQLCGRRYASCVYAGLSCNKGLFALNVKLTVPSTFSTVSMVTEMLIALHRHYRNNIKSKTNRGTLTSSVNKP